MYNSEKYFKGPSNSHRRSLYKAMGYTSSDLSRPHIGVVNTWSELNPGHYHLKRLSRAVKAGVWQNGGTPFEFNLFSTCGGIALGTHNMRYELPIRDVLAASVEIMASVHLFDGLVLLASCDNIIPGVIMGSMRMNIPTIVVTGGPMRPGEYNNKKLTQADIDEYAFAYQAGKIDETAFQNMEKVACPGPGACPVMGTANTMQILTEVIGLTLSGTSTAPANSGEKERAAKRSGRKILDLVRNSLAPREIVTEESLKNAVIVDLAIGGSTNAILHLLAYAYELGIELDEEIFDEYSRKVPLTCNVKPSGTGTVVDIHKSGGVPTIEKGLLQLLETNESTVNEKSVGQNITERAKTPDMSIIYSLDNPLGDQSGLAVLKGNICPRGAIVRTSAINNSMLQFEGPARIFHSDQKASQAVLNGEVKSGETIVIKYQGPSGGPGMNEIMATPLSLIAQDLDDSVALITDGRFSGFNRGPIIGHISPESARGGQFAIVQEGDIVQVDIDNRTLEIDVEHREIEKRLKNWSKPDLEHRRGYLNAYSKLALPAEKGGVLDIDLSK